MAHTSNPKIWVFNSALEDIASYIERWNIRFRRANAVTNEAKRDLFGEECGPVMYSTLRDLAQPAGFDALTWDTLSQLMVAHYDPQRNVRVERQEFRRRRRRQGENFNEYALALRRLASTCNFGTALDDTLIDQFLEGLEDKYVAQELTKETAVHNFSGMVSAAYRIQSEVRFATNTTPNTQAVNSISQGSRQKKPTAPSRQPVSRSRDRPPQQSRPVAPAASSARRPLTCFSCGGAHLRSDCKLRNAKCNGCGIAGHIQKVCKKAKSGGRVQQVTDDHPTAQASTSNNAVPAQSGDLFFISNDDGFKPSVTIIVEGQDTSFQLDTGSSVTITSEEHYTRHLRHLTLTPTAPLRSCTGALIPTAGQVSARVQMPDCQEILPLVVAKGNFPTLLGMSWIRLLHLDWNKIMRPAMVMSIRDSTVSELAVKYPNVFQVHNKPIKDFQVSIHLKEGAKPIFMRARDPPLPIRPAIERAIRLNQQKGFITPILSSRWATPIVGIPKPSNEARVCGDYSITVNPWLEMAFHPMPKIDDLSTVQGACFTVLDMSHAYMQLEVDPESAEILTWNTHLGLFRVNRLVYGIASAAAIFQSVIERILQGIPGLFIYQDDILIYAIDRKTCEERTHMVLGKLNDYNVQCQEAKCKFYRDSVTYLGHRIDKDGLHPLLDRVDAVRNAARPTNPTEVKMFTGMLNFYNKFLPNLSTVAAPLYQLLRRDQPWTWTKIEEDSFCKLKKLLASDTTLASYSLDLPLRMTCDASPVGAAAILSHVYDSGEERPIAFASKSFSDAERNYAQIEREGAAVIFGLKKFEKYLFGREFELVTDNIGLATLFSPSYPKSALAIGRIQRWALALLPYRYKIVHRAGSTIPHVDCLSRLPLPDTTAIENPENTVAFIAYSPLSATEVRNATAKDPVLSKVLFYVLHGWPDTDSDATLSCYRRKHLEFSVEYGCVMWGTRVVVPELLRTQVLHLLHMEHPGITRMKSLSRGYVWRPTLDQDIEDIVRQCSPCQISRPALHPVPLRPWPWSTRRWQRIHMDFAQKGDVKFFVILDDHSKFPFVFIMADTTAASVIGVLRELYATYGLAEEAVSDNGPPFQSADLAEFFGKNLTVHRFSPVGHPQSNGAAERTVRSFKDTLLRQLLDPSTSTRPIHHQVQAFLYTYRNTPHTLTKVTPSELFLGRRVRTHLSSIHPTESLRSEIRQSQEKTVAARGGQEREFQPNDLVWAHLPVGNKFLYRPGVVIRRVSSNSYEVRVGPRQKQLSADVLHARDPAAAPIDVETLPFLPSSDIPIPPSTSFQSNIPPTPVLMSTGSPVKEAITPTGIEPGTVPAMPTQDAAATPAPVSLPGTPVHPRQPPTPGPSSTPPGPSPKPATPGSAVTATPRPHQGDTKTSRFGRTLRPNPLFKDFVAK